MSNDIFALGALLSAGDDSGDDVLGALLSAGDDSGDDMGEITGEITGGDDVLGAVAKAMARHGHHGHHGMKAKLQKALLQRLMGYKPTATEYKPFSGKKTRRFPLGFLGAVGAGLTVDVSNRPQRPFRPEKISIPSTIGQFFGIVDFTIGNVPQTVSRGEVPALMFSELAIDSLIGADTGYISQDIVFTVRNKDGIAHNFEAGILGTMIAG